MASQKIGKLEAARRQLDTAIILWFEDGDVVSVHTLSAAAHGIIHDLNRAGKGPPMLFDSPTIDKKMRKQSVAILKSFENFCKHADSRKQREMEMEFDPDVTVGFMFTSLYGLNFLGEKLNSLELAFRSWVWIHFPHFLNDQIKEGLSNNVEVKGIETLRSIPKDKFLKHFLKVSISRSAKA